MTSPLGWPTTLGFALAVLPICLTLAPQFLRTTPADTTDLLGQMLVLAVAHLTAAVSWLLCWTVGGGARGVTQSPGSAASSTGSPDPC